MSRLLYNTLKLLRPRQWIKNFAIFAAITFKGQLFEPSVFLRVSIAFIIFCMLSSAIYIINDIFDVKRDRLHPFKRFRPLAHKDLSVEYALALAMCLLFVSFWVGFFVNPTFFLLTIAYFLLQVSYTVFLKHIVILDILAIASGYILRVYAGEFASGLHISVWLLLTTISISLLLAAGKRRSELTLLLGNPNTKIEITRKSLSRYSERLLDVYASIFATSTFISYALFTFLENESGFKLSIGVLMPDFLPSFFQKKWLMITILPVVYGLMRYLEDVYERHEGESPERVLLSDKPLLTSVLLWILLVIAIIYYVGP